MALGSVDLSAVWCKLSIWQTMLAKTSWSWQLISLSFQQQYRVYVILLPCKIFCCLYLFKHPRYPIFVCFWNLSGIKYMAVVLWDHCLRQNTLIYVLWDRTCIRETQTSHFREFRLNNLEIFYVGTLFVENGSWISWPLKTFLKQNLYNL